MAWEWEQCEFIADTKRPRFTNALYDYEYSSELLEREWLRMSYYERQRAFAGIEKPNRFERAGFFEALFGDTVYGSLVASFRKRAP